MNTRRGLKQGGLPGRWGLWSGIVGLLVFLSSLVALREPLGIAASVSLATVKPVTMSAPSPPNPSQDRARVATAYEQAPLTFEPNQGQTDAVVQFLARGRGYTVFLTASEVVLVWQPGGAPPSLAAQDRSGPPPRGRRAPPPAPAAPLSGAVLRWQFTGAAVPTPTAWEGLDPQPGQSNYFIGNDPQRWHTGVPHYGRVRSAQRYPGIDLVFYGNPRQLEYDWVVAPGADPTAIRLTVQGADQVRVDAEGNLVLTLAGHELIQPAPRVYQEIEGSRRPLAGRYVLLDPPGEPAAVAVPHYTVGFQVAAYDTTRPLVIDPVLVYSTYLGGSDGDGGSGIAVDSAGNVYVTGSTGSTDFPTRNTVQATLRGSSNAFVTRFTPTGQLVYSTYLGGSGYGNGGSGIAVDSAGNTWVTGSTYSTDFPTRNAVQPTLKGRLDAFVTQFTPTGQLAYSTYLGGSRPDDAGLDIAVDSAGHAYVMGYTASADFPTRNAVQATLRGGLVFLASNNVRFNQK
jgi:hypothetical protein